MRGADGGIGPDGNRGLDGGQGRKGERGRSYRGLKGEVGYVGIKGPDGADGYGAKGENTTLALHAAVTIMKQYWVLHVKAQVFQLISVLRFATCIALFLNKRTRAGGAS